MVRAFRRTQFDWVGFGKAVQAHRIKTEMNLRDCAKYLGVDHAMLFRVEQGAPCTAIHYLFLCEWAGIDPMKFTLEHPPKEDP